jgi:histidinol-phosphate aminotransferase
VVNDRSDVLSLANIGVRGLHPYQAGKPIEELQRELGLSKVVKLASNENPQGPSAAALAAVAAAAKDIHLYPDANAYELKQALCSALSKGGVSVAANQLTMGNGSNDVLDVIARVFLEPGKSAVFSQHAFIVYPLAVQSCGARAIVTQAKDWGHDLDAMAAAIEDDTRLVFIANPNNPTGTYLSRTEIIGFLEKVPADVIVVLDEAYIEYVDPSGMLDAVDGVALLAQYPNLIVTRTFSKAYGLAALRVGYAVSSPQVCDLLNRVRAPFNVNSLALSAAVAALQDQAYILKSRDINRSGMLQLEAGLKALGLPYIPSAGNFIAVEFPVARTSLTCAQIYQSLLEKGVIVRPVGVYDMPRHLRVSIGLADENQAFLDALALVLQ